VPRNEARPGDGRQEFQRRRFVRRFVFRASSGTSAPANLARPWARASQETCTDICPTHMSRQTLTRAAEGRFPSRPLNRRSPPGLRTGSSGRPAERQTGTRAYTHILAALSLPDVGDLPVERVAGSGDPATAGDENV